MQKKYPGFLLERLKFEIFSLLEGQIYGSTDFILKLKSISRVPGSVGSIATQILAVIEEEFWFPESSIKQNYFDLVDSEDMVSFINPSKLKDKSTEMEENPELPYLIAGRGEIKIGKIINYICTLRGIKITDVQREEFINMWKSSTENSSIVFKLVQGDDIAKYYNAEKYYNLSGSLGSSCMREEKNSLFKIYSKNPKKVKLLLYVDGDDKIHGRALVWKVKISPCESKYFMDRIYTNRDSDLNRFKQFADAEGWFYKKSASSLDNQNIFFVYRGTQVAGEVVVKLEGDFESYPYLDTLSFLAKDKKFLSNLSSPGGWRLLSVWGQKEKCSYCEGKVFNKHGDLCNGCSVTHKTLEGLGITTTLLAQKDK